MQRFKVNSLGAPHRIQQGGADRALTLEQTVGDVLGNEIVEPLHRDALGWRKWP
jgi:hypothetical protein